MVTGITSVYYFCNWGQCYFSPFPLFSFWCGAWLQLYLEVALVLVKTQILFFVCVELVDTLAALSLPLTKQATSPNRNHSSPFSAHFTVKSTKTSCIETGSAIHGFAIKEVRWRPRVTYQLYFLLVVENKIQLPHFTPLHVKKSNKFKIVNKLHFAGIQVCFKWVKLLNVG